MAPIRRRVAGDTCLETAQNPGSEAQVLEDSAAIPRNAVDPVEMAWLEKAKRGDSAACDWLMTRYRERVIRLAAHVLRRPAEAEDLAQEAFLRAFSQITDFRGDCAFYTWLYRIVVRLCLNRMRTPFWHRET